MAKQQSMNLIEFQRKFATEDSCQDHLFRKLKLFECKHCRYQATVTVGTVMEKTRTDLTKWFLAIYLVAHDKRGLSATLLSAEV